MACVLVIICLAWLEAVESYRFTTGLEANHSKFNGGAEEFLVVPEDPRAPRDSTLIQNLLKGKILIFFFFEKYVS